MLLPVQLTFRDVPHSFALEQLIHKKAAKLNKYYRRLTACRIMVEPVSKHHHHGQPYKISIDITVPEDEIVITRVKDADLYVAIRNAFDAAIRKIQSYAQKQRAR